MARRAAAQVGELQALTLLLAARAGGNATIGASEVAKSVADAAIKAE